MRDVANPPFFAPGSFPLCLAPMVGLSHAVLRLVIKEYRPENQTTIWPTEMLNSRRIPQEILGRNSETFVLPNEEFLVPQILGNQREEIEKSVQKLRQAWRLSGIDINMGCPVQKALKHNYGVSLMGDANYAAEVVRFAVGAAGGDGDNIPVSVKLRAVGSDKNLTELIDFVRKLQLAGASWVTLHPRTAEQKRRGQADWNQITVLKGELDLPIVGNGDIQTADDVFEMLSETRADKIMSGRALTARPWMVWQIGERLGMKPPLRYREQRAPQTECEEAAEYGRMLLRFIELCEQIFVVRIGLKENLVLRKVQFFIRTNHVWLQFGHRLMSLANRSTTLAELRDHVHTFFGTEQLMFRRTELRQ